MVTLFALSDGVTVTEPSSLALISGDAGLAGVVPFWLLTTTGTLPLSLVPTVCSAVAVEPSLTLSAGMVMLPSLPMTTLSSFDVHLPLLSLAMVAVFCLPSSSV